MGKTDWTSVSLPSSLMEKLDEFLECDKAKEMGLASRAQIISKIVRDFLTREKEVIFFLNSKKFKKQIPFKRISTMIFCELCKSQVCEHAIQLMKHKSLFDFEKLDDGYIMAEAEKYSK